LAPRLRDHFNKETCNGQDSESPATAYRHGVFPANVCLLGSVLPNGFAQVTPRGGTMVFDDEHLGCGTRQRQQPDAMKDAASYDYFRKPSLREEGLLRAAASPRFYGTAKIYKSGPVTMRYGAAGPARKRSATRTRRGYGC